MRRLLPLLLATALVAIGSPASAHGGGASSNYRTVVSGISPTGLPVTAVARLDGSGITVTNTGPGVLVIGGYQREPYIRIDRSGVQVNRKSPAYYLDQATTVGAVPAGADVKAAPEWVSVDATNSYTWHDHRIHWMSTAPPSSAQDDPDHSHLIENWTIPFEYAGKHGAITGTLTYVPPGALERFFNHYLGLIIVAVIVGVFALAIFVSREPKAVRRAKAEKGRTL